MKRERFRHRGEDVFAPLSWTGTAPGLEGAEAVADTNVPLCQTLGTYRATGRSQPVGSSGGVAHSGGGVKSHQVPSNGNSPASTSSTTRTPSARTAAPSRTQ